MSIEIKIYGDTAEDALRELRVFSDGAVPARSAGMTHIMAAGYEDGDAETGSGVQTPEGQAKLAEDPAPTRERGKPSPGKARRTKEEIAEDEAAEAAEASNIRSGAEDRTDPENADDEATQEADAADEQAEAASEELTIDDVKALAVEYQEKYGFEAVQEDGPKIFVEAVGKPPEGEPFWKFSILPTDQASLTKLATIWRKAIDLNPLKREVKGA